MFDSNKIIDELNVLAEQLPDIDQENIRNAVDLIEYLMEHSTPSPDADLKMYLSQLINILGHVSMNLSKGPFTTVLTPEQAERRSKPRGPAGCDFTPPPWFPFTPTTPSEPPH